ncbi:MAG: hypothetical protein Q7R81_01750 [Candidatus Peregrinibacteria bacterium]|nr:hypothetical protein [Candidatus Peregrinibacteria bacterium]
MTHQQTAQAKRQLARPVLSLLAGVGLLGASMLLMLVHIHAIREVKDISLPLATQLPILERRLSLLSEQIEASELHAALRQGSQEERLHVYVLPAEVDMDRLLATFEVARIALEQRGLLSSMSAIVVGEQHTVSVEDATLSALPLSFQMTVTAEGLSQFLTLMESAGLLTVGDTLTDAEIAQLFERTEAESPAGIVALEQFLTSDLLDYALEPQPFEDRLLRTFSSDAFSASFRSITQSSLLRSARELLGSGIGAELTAQKLWPLPFLTMMQTAIAERDGEWYDVTFTLETYARATGDEDPS